MICNPVYSSSLGKSLSSSSSSFIDSWFSHRASDPGEMGYVATWLVDGVETHWVLAVLCVAAWMSMDRLLSMGISRHDSMGHWDRVLICRWDLTGHYDCVLMSRWDLAGHWDCVLMSRWDLAGHYDCVLMSS